jgi:hypothetical protein
MKTFSVKALILFSFLGLSACSPVQFYSDSNLTHKSGLKYYTVKPYIIVERELSNGNIVKASTIYIPDLENPQYVVLKDGLGSKKLDIKLSDGAVTSLGLTTEPLIAESVEALSALISKSASAIDDLSMLKGNYPGAAASTITELYEVLMIEGKTSVRKIEIR